MKHEPAKCCYCDQPTPVAELQSNDWICKQCREAFDEAFGFMSDIIERNAAKLPDAWAKLVEKNKEK